MVEPNIVEELGKAPSLAVRKVHRSSGSMMVVLPMEWVRGQGIENGDRVDIKQVGTMLVIIPQKKPGGGR